MSTATGDARTMISQIAALRTVLVNYRTLFTVSLVLIIAMQLSTAAVSVLTSWGTAVVARGALGDLGPVLVCLIVVLAGYGILVWQESWWSHVLAYRVLSRLRMVLHVAISRIAPAGLHGRRTGQIAGAALNDVEQLEWFYAHTAAATISAVVVPTVMVATMVGLVGPAGLLLLVPLALLLVPLWLLAPRQARQGEQIRVELSALKAEALEGAQGMRDLVAIEATDRWTTALATGTARLQRRRRTFVLRAGAEAAWGDALLASTTVLVLAGLAFLVQQGNLAADVVPVAIVVVFHIFAPVTAVLPMWQRLGELAAAARRVYEIAEAPPSASPREVVDAPFSAEGTISLQGIGYRYPGAARAALADLDVSIAAGLTTAVVGASGAGKSTLGNLLVRFVDPDTGTVRYGSRTATTVDEDALRDRVVLVPQQNHALRATVADNLRLGAPEATEADLWRVLDDVALADEVRELPAGLDTELGEGGNSLSGGQLQRLAIARALLRDPDVLVLDEPVAHLDAFAEAHLNDTVRRLRRGRTTIVIAHRVSTIREADDVVWLADGQLAGQGRHEDLLADPRYRALLGDPAVDEEPSAPPTSRAVPARDDCPQPKEEVNTR